jgi:GT2 family glycosyltransferase
MVVSEFAALNPDRCSGSPVTRSRSSVIIVSHNSRGDLEACLGSLLSGDRREFEVILVDNDSTDGSAEYVEQAFPVVQVIRSDANRGFGYGANLGARCATGEYLAFLNPDTVPEPEWLATLIRALEAGDRARMATSRILLLSNPARINACGNDVHLTGLTLCRGMGAELSAYAEVIEVGAVSGAAFVISKELFHALGGFDERFFPYMEDTDLSLRARLVGYHCICVPESVVLHDYALRFVPLKTFHLERNRIMMLLKCYRWATLLILVPTLLLGEVVTWGFVLLRERRWLTDKLRAYAWIARHWDQVMEARRRTQASRQVRDRDLLAICTFRLDYEQTGGGPAALLAHWVFDPLFCLLRGLALSLVWW